MIKLLLKSIVKFFENLLHNILIGWLLGIFGLPLLISWATGTLDFLAQFLSTSMPLWATISLIAICCLYSYVKVEKIQAKSNPVGKPSIPSYETKYIQIGKYKWETKIYKSGHFEVEKYPFCVEHDLRFIYDNDDKQCPHVENFRKCSNRLSKSDEFRIYQSAQSIIENKIRNKQY